MAGTFTIAGLSATEAAGSRQFGPLTIVGTLVIGETLEAPLAAGDNTFAVPVGAVAVLIVPPLTPPTLKLRTNKNAADVGLTLSESNPTVYSFPAATPTSLIVNASALSASPLTLAFI